ncbi:MAG: phosphatase PAP2 family protein [Elusimicrobiota bacterium]
MDPDNRKKYSINDYTLIDALFVGYMVILSVFLLFFHHGVTYWYMYIAVHVAVISLIVVFVPMLAGSKNKSLVFLRWFYPILLFAFNYKEINAFTHILVPEWADRAIMDFEIMIFGAHPTLWLERFVSPVVTEIMKFDYFSYYLMIWAGAGILYVSGTKKEYVRYLSTVCLAFYISYIGFIVVPVRGPRYTLYDKYTRDYVVTVGDYYGPYVEDDVAGKQTRALDGYAFTRLQDLIMRYGSLHGGCMPSSHIAVAFVCMMMMWIYRRKVFLWYLPFVSVLCVAVVYNRYHYVSDVAAGVLVGLMSLWLTPRLQKSWERFLKNY